MEKREEIKAKARKVIEDTMNVAIQSDDEDLIKSGKIDSFTMLMLITLMREQYNVSLDMEDLDFDSFTSLNSFSNLVLTQAQA